MGGRSGAGSVGAHAGASLLTHRLPPPPRAPPAVEQWAGSGLAGAVKLSNPKINSECRTLNHQRSAGLAGPSAHLPPLCLLAPNACSECRPALQPLQLFTAWCGGCVGGGHGQSGGRGCAASEEGDTRRRVHPLTPPPPDPPPPGPPIRLGAFPNVSADPPRHWAARGRQRIITTSARDARAHPPSSAAPSSPPLPASFFYPSFARACNTQRKGLAHEQARRQQHAHARQAGRQAGRHKSMHGCVLHPATTPRIASAAGWLRRQPLPPPPLRLPPPTPAAAAA